MQQIKCVARYIVGAPWVVSASGAESKGGTVAGASLIPSKVTRRSTSGGIVVGLSGEQVHGVGPKARMRRCSTAVAAEATSNHS